MASRLENIAGLFSNVRTRNIIIITGLVLGLTIFVGLYGLLKSNKGQVGGEAIVGQPPKLQSTPEFTQTVTPEQESLVQETNTQMINKAQQTGGSAISSAIGGPGELPLDSNLNNVESNAASTGAANANDNYTDYINKLLKTENGPNQGGTNTDNNVEKPTTTNKSSQADAQQLAEIKRLQDQQKNLEAQQQAQELKAEQDALIQLSQSMETQAKAVLSGWVGGQATPMQVYVEGELPKEVSTGAGNPGAPGTTTNTSSSGTTEVKAAPVKSPAVIKAGDILFAILETSVNSDEPGPIMATIVSGKYKGARVVGGLQPMPQITGTNGAESVTLTFNTMNIPTLPNSVGINAVAIDAETARTALASDVDHHYLYRYGLTFAASFLEGYGNAITQSGSVQTNAANGTMTTFQQTLTPRQEILAALGQVGTNISSQLGDSLSRPNTVTVDAGMSLGILFLSDVTLQT